MQLMTVKIRKIMQMNVNVIIVIIAVIIIIRMMVMLILMMMIHIITMIVMAMMTMKMLMLMISTTLSMLMMMITMRCEGCSLHAVALLDSILIDKLHQLSLSTGKWAQLPFFGPVSHGNPQSGWHYSY